MDYFMPIGPCFLYSVLNPRRAVFKMINEFLGFIEVKDDSL
jgi:hypothetical protein